MHDYWAVLPPLWNEELHCALTGIVAFGDQFQNAIVGSFASGLHVLLLSVASTPAFLGSVSWRLGRLVHLFSSCKLPR